MVFNQLSYYVKKYSSNLSDSQWTTILNILEDKRKRKHSLREIFDAIFYLLKTGCQWRVLPKEFPNWKLVYYYFTQWKANGIFELLNEVIRGKIRKKKIRTITPRWESLIVKVLRLPEVEPRKGVSMGERK
ncbi:transposase [Sinomicrobium pectinilyticum]|uniref:transposase n=1 Tax=Sinomicrobium pectinilyticum TaxID=1084421 RepID=UPI0019D005B7|nr:transposase [Sinomicrobium pectinilyticum]